MARSVTVARQAMPAATVTLASSKQPVPVPGQTRAGLSGTVMIYPPKNNKKKYLKSANVCQRSLHIVVVFLAMAILTSPNDNRSGKTMKLTKSKGLLEQHSLNLDLPACMYLLRVWEVFASAALLATGQRKFHVSPCLAKF